jgi:DHA1 family bicyclomycin/chloramphenicol resistance-like MFS transporter
VLASALSGVGMFAYIASAPDVFINIYHTTPGAFGLAFSCVAVGYIGAGQVNRVLLRRHSFDRILRIATIGNVFAALLLLVDASTGFLGIAGLLIPLFGIMAGFGFIQPNALAGAMTSDPHRTGTIASLFGFLQGTLASAGATLTAALHNGTPRPMAYVILLGMVSALTALYFLVGLRPKAAN